MMGGGDGKVAIRRLASSMKMRIFLQWRRSYQDLTSAHILMLIEENMKISWKCSIGGAIGRVIINLVNNSISVILRHWVSNLWMSAIQETDSSIC